MKKVAFVFPGQGSQKPKMGEDIFQAFNQAPQLLEKAEKVLARPLYPFIFGDQTSQLDITLNTQPAIFFIDYMIFLFLKDNGLSPSVVLGHSLGEVVALVAAEVIDFETGIYLVGQRANFMEEEAQKNPGAMMAVIGLEQEIVEDICTKFDGLEIANYNSPGQIVVSGQEESIVNSSENFLIKGAKRTIRLPVKGGFHSSLMKNAQERFSEVLLEVTFQPPKIPLVQNYSGIQETEPTVIKDNLSRQISSPVKWVDCCLYAQQVFNVDYWVETGPSNVLANLIKRIIKDVEIYNANNLKSAMDIRSFLSSEKGVG